MSKLPSKTTHAPRKWRRTFDLFGWLWCEETRCRKTTAANIFPEFLTEKQLVWRGPSRADEQHYWVGDRYEPVSNNVVSYARTD